MTTRTVTAFFDSRSDATRAVEQLVAAGIPRAQVRLLPETEQSGSYSSGSSYDVDRDEKGFWESLADMFFPAEDRYSYAEAMHRGDIMVTATVDDTMADRAEDILEEHGSVSIDEREASWRSEGWSGYEGSSASMSAGSDASASTLSTGSSASLTGSTDRASAEREGVIPLAEEELRVGKRDVSRGRVKVRSYVVETPVEESVSLREEEVHLERRPVDRVLGDADADRLFKERSIEVEERGEEALVEKRARVREEVAVGKTVEERTETVHDTVRRTEVEIDDERSGNDDTTRRRRTA